MSTDREIKFRYILQHKETGRLLERTWTLDELEVGCVKEWLNQCNVTETVEFAPSWNGDPVEITTREEVRHQTPPPTIEDCWLQEEEDAY